MNIDRAAWALIRRFGDLAPEVSQARSAYCKLYGRHASAANWRCIEIKLAELMSNTRQGRLH